MFFAGAHSVELAGETGDEFDEVVDEFFLCGFVSLVFDDGDGDAMVIEEAFEVGEAKASESVFIGDEDAAIFAVLYVLKELIESATVFIEAASNVRVGGFDCPSVVVSVVSKPIELTFKIAVVFLTVAGDTCVESNAVSGASIASEAEKFSVWDTAVAAGRARIIRGPRFDTSASQFRGGRRVLRRTHRSRTTVASCCC